MLGGGQRANAQLRAQEITFAQSLELPYRESGKLTVRFGQDYYFGTATAIRRYTGLTAGHLLYDPKSGFAASTNFQQGLYNDSPPTQEIGYFAVLSGYQTEAAVDPDADAAFARDMGYFVLLRPVPGNEWAAFSDDPSLLTTGGDYLALGYAAESFPGDKLASVQIAAPYTLDLPGLYQNMSFYTEEGMSGGPVYLSNGGKMTVGAVNVAGTDPPHRAESGARAITADVGPLLIDAEYTHGAITGGVITGPLTVTAGSTAIYKVGVTFADGETEGAGMPHRYQELELIAQGAVKRSLTVTQFKPERFSVAFGRSLRSGTPVVLRLLRNTVNPQAQAPLQTLTVNIQ